MLLKPVVCFIMSKSSSSSTESLCRLAVVFKKSFTECSKSKDPTKSLCRLVVLGSFLSKCLVSKVVTEGCLDPIVVT